MPESGLNGVLQEHHITTSTQYYSHEQTQTPSEHGNISLTNDEERPAKRRKTADSRPESPPWRRFTAAGPTSYVDNGKRRSGRTNAVPLELQPQSARRQTRAAYDKAAEDKNKSSRPLYNLTRKQNQNDAQMRQLSSVRRQSQTGSGRPPKSPKSPLLPKVQAVKMAPASPKHKKRSFSQLHSHKSPDSKHWAAMQEELNRKRLELRRLTGGKFNRGLLSGHTSSDEEDNNDDEPVQSESPRSLSPPTIRNIRFVVNPPKSSILTPHNIPALRKFDSFEDFLANDPEPPRAGEDVLTPEKVAKEARARLMVQAAKRPGHLLHKRVRQERLNPQLEPERQYAHRDHLLEHVKDFHGRLLKEQKEHLKKAAFLANLVKKEVEERAKRTRVKTAEEIEQEIEQAHITHTRASFRVVVKDIERLWLAVEAEVNEIRRKQYEEEREAKLKRKLDKLLERRKKQINDSRHRRDSSETASDLDRRPTDESGSETSSESSSEGNLSGNNSDSDADPEGNSDDELDPEELKKKYAEALDSNQIGSPDPMASEVHQIEAGVEMDAASEHLIYSRSSPAPSVSQDHSHNENGSDSGSSGADEEIDKEAVVQGSAAKRRSQRKVNDSNTLEPETLELQGSDESDASTTMDSEDDYDTDDDDDGSGVESEGGNLYGFFSKADIEKATQQMDPAEEDAPNDPMGLDEMELATSDAEIEDQHVESTSQSQLADIESPDDRTSREPSTQASPHTSATKASEPESISSIEPHTGSQPPATPIEEKSTIRTPVPHLLRGTLRVYQHEGLDWLADLYQKGRNGILADEMGLGKTIQSISLLAHLAVEHEVWGPHLIVVPTSVMLNWEMEFKKFCPGFKILTYYGDQKERALKRKGWMTPDAFNVCITSYQLVLQDQNMFKRRAWHYMILDEAHNIKNFRSDRWQTMMTFNTRARLLLTGTPLQNNLQELASLLVFLDPHGDNDMDLNTLQELFKQPVEAILEHGRQVLTEKDKALVEKLHTVIRPFLLRRLKKDVEKQMPLKYEHIELCRLSKRQRQLYDGFMSRAATKETLSSGNYLSIINALMQLRKVCNHPDLFETRPIMTSLALPRSEPQKWEPNNFYVRRLLKAKNPLHKVDFNFLQLCPISREDISANEVLERSRLFGLANTKFRQIRESQWKSTNHNAQFSGDDVPGVMESLKDIRKASVLHDLDRTIYIDTYRNRGRPLIGRALLQKLAFGTTYETLSRSKGAGFLPKLWESQRPVESLDLVLSLEKRSQHMEPLVQKFACITPALTAADLVENIFPSSRIEELRSLPTAQQRDPFHEARMKLSIAFPDKRLLQYDCGKLQRLATLLRQLQSGGHRALIFTQMTKVLDILEQFLNIHGHRYLRLDGATKIEQRQILTDRFNNDPRILCFILSSRSGGLGINLTGADSVIFYDLDWNPAMDKQCTDRAHRIGQTRDVHIYRFVSEHTIEANILRKASQKQMLDDVVIQEGEFTTDFFNKASYRDMLPDDGDAMASAAMDRVLGNEQGPATAFEGAEDKEDIAAAKVAVLEDQHADDGDFEDKATPGGSVAQALGPYAATNAALAEAEERESNIDEYMVKLKKWLLKDVPIDSGREKSKKSKKKGAEHRVKKAR